MDVQVEITFGGHQLRVTAEYEEGSPEEGLYPNFTVYCVEILISPALALDISDLVSRAMGDLGGDDPISHAAWETYKESGKEEASED